jgi:multiple sugar transport system substrate-binding protein
VHLKGMTWDHPRGVDPLVAASRVWQQQGEMEIVWDRRSLQDFETYPVQQLAREYDLIVIDHPHVGQVVAEQCLLPFAPARLDGIAQGALGQSLESYRWGGQVWALPIDAAAQVQVRAPERLPVAPTTWDGVLALAEQGRVACPLLPPHSVLSLFTLYGLQGGVPQESGSPLLAPERGEAALRALGQLYRLIDPACLDMDPIAVLEAMAASDARIDLAPIIFGYVSYAREGFRPARLAFSDLAAMGAEGPRGSSLGGTGIAVSALGAHEAQAADFALWVAGEEVQKGLYAQAGGQPGHAAAWSDAAVNAPVLDFYRATRRTLDAAWVRPRHDGYMAFQHEASCRINQALRRGEGEAAVIRDINALFKASL